MPEPPSVPVLSVPEAVARAVAAPDALLALGMPGCAACMLLPASLAEIARARPALEVVMGEFRGPDDWRRREDLLWPRGVHVSRASVPALALLSAGVARATRAGGGPAHLIDAWLTPLLGTAPVPPPDGPTPAEIAALDTLQVRVARTEVYRRARAPQAG